MNQSRISMWYFDNMSLWHPRHITSDCQQMKKMGVDIVIVNHLECDSLRSLKTKAKYAHDHGMKIYYSPGRVAGLFAAGPHPCSMFLGGNLDARMKEAGGKARGPVACVNHPAFIQWFYPYLQSAAIQSGVDGIVFDEPKDAHDACYCKYCLGLTSNHSEAGLIRLREEGMADLLGKVCNTIKKEKPAFATVAMLMPNATSCFKARVLAQKDLDCVGHDGPLCLQGAPPWKNQKTSLLESTPPFMEMARKAGKKVYGLVETFAVFPRAHASLRQNLKKIIPWRLDHYSFNFYGHENGDPDAVMDILAEGIAAIRKASSKQRGELRYSG